MYPKLLSLAVICTVTNVAFTATDENYRLNTPIIPSAYELLITPYFNTSDERAFTFDGEVTIHFTTTSNTNQIKLHSQELNFTAADIVVTNSDTQTVLSLNETNALVFNTYYSFAYINLLLELNIGTQYSVKITYTGPIRDDLQGFYRNYYLENGVKKWLGATQMEPTSARKAFPCFDEPGLKATFIIRIDRPSNYQQSLSNMKLQTSLDLGNGYFRETFYPTPRMPTYLVAFLVSEFEAAQFNTNGTQEFGVYTRPEAKNQSVFAFEFGMEVLKDLGAFYDIDYYSTNEYIKMDHVALPDFRAGAMENWGLIKYREALLLYDPTSSGPYYKYRVAQIVAHETVHMWFGDLVTCHWWSNIWLNEGFATYFQDYMTSFISPELGSANQLVIGSVYVGYESDDVLSSPPITNLEVNSPAEISAHFQGISYQKAGSVIRMIHHLIETDAFQFGVQTYLKSNSFGSGYPELLYAAFDEGVSRSNALAAYPNASVADVMGSWVSQAGYPVLQVDIDFTTEIVTLSQKRFFKNSSISSTQIYKIPITYTSGVAPNFNNTKPAFIMDTESYEFSIANISNAHSWVIINLQETGFYRVNYDDHTWQIIASALSGSDREVIHHLNRAKIVNDLFALFYADQVNFSTLHDVVEFLSEESDYSVWYAALKGFRKLRSTYMGHADALPTVEAYMLSLISLGVDRFGYEERSTDTFEDLRNRQQILEIACDLDHSGCVEHALAFYSSLKENGTEVSPSLRPVVYETGLRYGNGEDYDFLWNRMVTTNVANEMSVIANALGHSTDQEKLRRYLVSMTEDNSPIKTQDLLTPLTSVLSNYSNLQLVIESLQEEYELWESIHNSMDSILTTIASALCTDEDFDNFETFLANCTECTNSAKASARTTMENRKVLKLWADSHKLDILPVLRGNCNTVIPSLFIIVLSFVIFIFKY